VPWRHRLDTKLMLAMTVVGVVPLALFAFYTSVLLRQSIGETSREILMATTRDYADRVGTWVQRGFDQVWIASRVPTIQKSLDWPPPLSARADAEQQLRNLRDQSPVFIRSAAILDMSGRPVFGYPRSVGGAPEADRPWFERPLLTAEPAFSRSNQDETIGQLVFSAPLIVEGSPVGVIRVGYHLSALHHLLTQMSTGVSAHAFVALIDAQNGEILATDLTPEAEVLSGWKTGAGVPVAAVRTALDSTTPFDVLELEHTWMGVERWIVCLHTIERLPWRVAYFLPSEQYLAPIKARVAFALAIAAGLCLLLLSIGYGTSRMLSRHLRFLSSAVRNVAAGNLNVRVSVPTRDECGLLAESFNDMAGQLARRTAALEEAREAAEAASRAKSEFLSVVSHEVRTPLNAVIGYSSLLLDDAALGDKQRGQIEVIRRSGTQLLEMLNSILDFSKVEAGKLEIERAPFALLDLISDLIDNCAAEAGERGLELLIEPVGSVPQRLVADAPKIRQILLNLVFNSLKFTHEGGVRILVGADFSGSDPEGFLEIMVEDTGIGITPEVRKRLFQPFTQGDASTTRRYGGTGLGLAISRQIARACGGDLVECSPQSGGAAFALSLPVDRQGDAVLPTVAPLPHLRDLTVGVVSVNAFSRAFLCEHLGRAGVRCVDATEVPAAWVIDQPAAVGEGGGAFDAALAQALRCADAAPVLHLYPPVCQPRRLAFRGRMTAQMKPVLPHELLALMNALIRG